ncbi:hypothetical protein AWN90_37790 [Nocardia terpenica]|uniref:Uncharacterized protein n=1 Tax=Nocardia terpenica TaxID=455432 RepID=A0A164L3R1_9NOCA|nr:hypothetical protein AWN90_37790 [Nocardia terpenica]
MVALQVSRAQWKAAHSWRRVAELIEGDVVEPAVGEQLQRGIDQRLPGALLLAFQQRQPVDRG